MKDQLRKFKAHKPSPSETPAPAEKSDEVLFAEAMREVKKLPQDKINPERRRKVQRAQKKQADGYSARSKQVAADFHFSDMFEARLPDEGPVRYCRDGEATHTLKRLRRGDFYPELVLDLHGLTKELAKAELGALLHAARKENIDCVSVMHGIGQGILKRALPHYLIQHPHVRAFHQAPLEYGGNAALLVLVDTGEPGDMKR
ncbi:endonuclease SmrB [Alteromonas sp. ASW11-19]|uniref:Ribosome rescue factor SmrB n=1 Tax=Alteromonas salexigens TaxID=2982530 RepID=A0ABT2VPW3_9ALTE|nr:endonuclease SmrB [Alteromonas salexigens]MCU7555114.1 endonuclease SmrB [Alteromonas salexigens]